MPSGCGPRRGKKAFTLQTLPPVAEEFPEDGALGKAGGFSLHAGTVAGADERSKLERLCRYISRPALAEKRLSLTPGGNVRYHFKTPWRDGTTHVVFEPLDFIARLAALVPKPRVNLTRFHGVFAPNSRYRARVTPAGRGPGGKGKGRDANCQMQAEPTEPRRRSANGWAQRLRRVFGIDIERCAACGGTLRVIACIEDRDVIETILAHRRRRTSGSSGCGSAGEAHGPHCRAPPPTSPLG